MLHCSLLEIERNTSEDNCCKKMQTDNAWLSSIDFRAVTATGIDPHFLQRRLQRPYPINESSKSGQILHDGANLKDSCEQ
jgi:hypothetical protein